MVRYFSCALQNAVQIQPDVFFIPSRRHMVKNPPFPILRRCFGNDPGFSLSAEEKIQIVDIPVFINNKFGFRTIRINKKMIVSVFEIPVQRFEPESNGSGFRIDIFSRVMDQGTFQLTVDLLHPDFGCFSFNSRVQQHGKGFHGDLHGMLSINSVIPCRGTEIFVERGMQDWIDFGSGRP